MNLREQKLIWRISKMRANLQIARQRLKLEQARAQQQQGHQLYDDNCPCPACMVRRALTGGSIPGVTVVRLTPDAAEAPAVEPSGDTKH